MMVMMMARTPSLNASSRLVRIYPVFQEHRIIGSRRSWPNACRRGWGRWLTRARRIETDCCSLRWTSSSRGPVPSPTWWGRSAAERPATVTRMLGALQQLVDQAPPFTAEFDVLVEELHAQRLTVAALQAELSAFDHQLEVIEKSLAPLESWAHQWTRLRQSLTETLRSAAPESDGPESGPPESDAPESDAPAD